MWCYFNAKKVSRASTAVLDCSIKINLFYIIYYTNRNSAHTLLLEIIGFGVYITLLESHVLETFAD